MTVVWWLALENATAVHHQHAALLLSTSRALHTFTLSCRHETKPAIVKRSEDSQHLALPKQLLAHECQQYLPQHAVMTNSADNFKLTLTNQQQTAANRTMFCAMFCVMQGTVIIYINCRWVAPKSCKQQAHTGT
jgi:hypothetical protein